MASNMKRVEHIGCGNREKQIGRKSNFESNLHNLNRKLEDNKILLQDSLNNIAGKYKRKFEELAEEETNSCSIVKKVMLTAEKIYSNQGKSLKCFRQVADEFNKANSKSIRESRTLVKELQKHMAVVSDLLQEINIPKKTNSKRR